MSYLHDDRHDEDDDEIHTRPRDREVTLSTGTILGIFFGLALLCGAFFGFGYNMGSKTRPETVAAAEPAPSSSADFSKFKPAPGSPAVQPAPSSVSQKGPDNASKSAYNAPTTAPVVLSTPRPAATPPPTAKPPVETPAAPAPHTPAPLPAAHTPVAITPAVEGAGSFVVQVAAVSHQEDADLLDSALHRKGYSVAVHTEAQDKLYHIQVGPFANKKDAEAMRQRLLTDGYNAIVK